MPDKHLLLAVPDAWSTDQKGSFFEALVSDLLRPMRYAIESRLRVTGMEIDLLAKALDRPGRILVECKAQRDALPADTISKLLGNVAIQKADAGWLFSTSDLTKDGRGLWREIQDNQNLARTFTWYPPGKCIEILVDQSSIVSSDRLDVNDQLGARGDVTLVCSPEGRHWIVELLEHGIPVAYTVFDAKTGGAVDSDVAARVTEGSERFSALTFRCAQPKLVTKSVGRTPPRAPVARVVSGDTWADLRPARPMDFVGRDDVIDDVAKLLCMVNDGETTTRTFAIQGPSGWGKSSLVLKLADVATSSRKFPACSFTAIDTRSATSATFVSSALQLALEDAAQAGLIRKRGMFGIESLSYPLDSHDVRRACEELLKKRAIAVITFDQFEELFAKETLFDTFERIRELSIDLDAKQLPIVLGFAWKTDVSLPQQHPAYHLWHGLADRRHDFRLRQFGAPDIVKVVGRAEREIGVKLTSALRARLVEQCQGYPWLLKKLLVHVSKRLQEASSQFALLERELDVEVLFKEDVAGLKQQQLRCLKYVAERAPAFVSDVEEHFSSETTNLLMAKRLLVRSGLNYVIYWDIFRDYLIDGRVPHIPWARTFQRDPRSSVEALKAISRNGSTSAAQVAKAMGGAERAALNVLSDLVALQIVDRVGEDQYRLAAHVKVTTSAGVADAAHAQLAKHVLCRELDAFDREQPLTVAHIETIVRKMKAASSLADDVVHQYAMNCKRWLLFSGHLEERDGAMYRATGAGAQRGILSSRRLRGARFLGAGTPDALERLLRVLSDSAKGVDEASLVEAGLRNALYDARALGLVSVDDSARVLVVSRAGGVRGLIRTAKQKVLAQPAAAVVVAAARANPTLDLAQVGALLQKKLGAEWKPSSARRYANGVRSYIHWASERA